MQKDTQINQLAPHRHGVNNARLLDCTAPVLSVLMLVMLSACGGGSVDQVIKPGQGGSEPELGAATPAADSDRQTETVSNNQPLLDADPATILPGVIATQRLQSSELILGYTASAQEAQGVDAFVSESWELMQDCLGVTANAPTVVLQVEDVQPLSSLDDVIFSFEGRIVASSHDEINGALIQVLESDVIDTGTGRGDYLRSILGRYIWRSNGLAERDYDYSCARSA